MSQCINGQINKWVYSALCPWLSAKRVKDTCPFETFTDGVREETQTLEVVSTDGRAGFDVNAEQPNLAI